MTVNGPYMGIKKMVNKLLLKNILQFTLKKKENISVYDV